MRELVIGGIVVPLRAAQGLSQNYEPIQAVNRFRTGNGTLKQQSAWRGKVRTVISADGVLPNGLDGLDYSQSIVIKCIAERAVQESSNVITVPANRRSDYGVEGKALVGGINWVSTPVTMSGDIATLDVVTDATAYRAIYWPELTCFIDPPNDNRDARKSIYGWELICEEI